LVAGGRTPSAFPVNPRHKICIESPPLPQDFAAAPSVSSPRSDRSHLTGSKEDIMRSKLAGVVVAVACSAFGATRAHADVVQDWNLEALRVSFPAGPPQARVLAMVHIAMHDAINAVTGTYETYAPKVNVPPSTSAVAAGAAAAHHVLVALFPQLTAVYDQSLAASLANIPEPDRTNGVRVGDDVGALILQMRANDGFSDPAPYTPGSGPGVWVPTQPAFAPALLPGLGRVTPFALNSGSQFRPAGPPPLHSRRYAADVNEVKLVGSIDAEALGFRTPEQGATARFWLGNSIPIFQGIARQVSTISPHDLSSNARFFALMSIAGADAYIAAWDAKYTYNFWRPVTAIHDGDIDGNPATTADTSWRPLAETAPFPGTPPFPDYVSGHTTYTRAVVRVLEEVFGRGEFPFAATTVNPAIPPAERNRQYDNFRELSDEMIEARILAGIHFRSADRDGDRLGRQVAQFAIRHVLRPAHGNN
jgi:hypothetical protein